MLCFTVLFIGRVNRKSRVYYTVRPLTNSALLLWTEKCHPLDEYTINTQLVKMILYPMHSLYEILKEWAFIQSITFTSYCNFSLCHNSTMLRPFNVAWEANPTQTTFLSLNSFIVQEILTETTLEYVSCPRWQRWHEITVVSADCIPPQLSLYLCLCVEPISHYFFPASFSALFSFSLHSKGMCNWIWNAVPRLSRAPANETLCSEWGDPVGKSLKMESGTGTPVQIPKTDASWEKERTRENERERESQPASQPMLGMTILKQFHLAL